MAFTISGYINHIEDVREIPTQNGSFKRRSIRLDASSYNRMTGEKYENYPTFDFMGDKCDMLNNFKQGDLVTISFSLKGVQYSDKNTKEIKYFNSINGYDIQPYQKRGEAQTQSPDSTSAPNNDIITQPVVSPQPQEEEDDLPF